MVITFSKIKKCRVVGKDAELGRVKDIYFSEGSWKIRYLVLDTSNWLFGKKILISPQSLSSEPFYEGRIQVDLTKEQIMSSPFLAEDLPVSRHHEIELSHYYGWEPPFWVSAPFTNGIIPEFSFHLSHLDLEVLDDVKAWIGKKRENYGYNLSSCNEIKCFKIRANSEEFGEVDDFIVDSTNCSIIYLSLKVNKLLWSSKVVCPTVFVKNIDREERVVNFKFSKTLLTQAPELDIRNFDRGYEKKIYQHYLKKIPTHQRM